MELGGAKSREQSELGNFKEWLINKGFGMNTAGDYSRFIEKKLKPWLHENGISIEAFEHEHIMQYIRYRKARDIISAPYFTKRLLMSSSEGVSTALIVNFSLFIFNSGDSLFVNSYDKSLLEKLYLIDKLEAKEKQAFFSIMDALLAKKKMKDTLSDAIGLAS